MEIINFVPQIIQNCEDIQQELINFSHTSKINQDFIWFDILNIHTFIKLEAESDFHLMDANQLNQFEEDEFYKKEPYFIKQTYDIRICPKKMESHLSLEFGDHFDKMYLILGDDFLIIDDEKFYKDIFNFIDSLMAWEKVIFRQQYLQREELKQKLQEYSQKEDFPRKILLKTAPGFIPYQPPKFMFTLKKQWEEKGKQAPENALFGVGTDGVIAEYIKAIEGIDGRNLKGKYIKNNNFQAKEDSLMTYDKEFIIKEELPDKFLFKAIVPGYVKLTGKSISFSTKFELDTINTINSPMLLGGTQTGIELTIKAKDEMRDAIGSNMVIEASIINILGSIGENTHIDANKIFINGQTHQSSIINAKEAQILTHKGKAYGDDINVKNLDAGFIQADNIFVDSSNGGEVYGKKVSIGTLKSNNKINFSQKCRIKEIQGGENLITISAASHIKTKETMDFIDKKLSLLKANMQGIFKDYQELLLKMKKNKPIIDKIKSADTNTQKAMLADDDIKITYRKYAMGIKKLKNLKAELMKFQETFKELNHTLFEIEDETLQAKITTEHEWKQENKILYHRDHPISKDDILIIQDGENVNISIDTSTKKLVKSN